eukprot:m.252618 g.252618  ORF g.252618 m.252618 type:complete len:58 (-) comp17526_c0_seq21:5884-6057(-)
MQAPATYVRCAPKSSSSSHHYGKGDQPSYKNLTYGSSTLDTLLYNETALYSKALVAT